MKNKNDISSFIPDVDASVKPLPSPMGHLEGQRDSYIPVLPVSKSAVLWQRVRWPLLAVIAVLLILVVGLITRETLIKREIKNAIYAAQSDESTGTVDKIHSAGKDLSRLADKHSDRPEVQAAFAWNLILKAVLLGPERDLLAKAEAAVEPVKEETGNTCLAARAGLMMLKGQNKEALDLATQGLKVHPSEPRLELVRAWSHHRLDKSDSALTELDVARSASSGYIPLTIAAVKIAFESGKRAKAIELTKELNSGSTQEYLYASLITLTLSLPRWGAEKPNNKQVDFFLEALADLKPKIDSAPPKLASIGRFLEGRIYLLADRISQAVEVLRQATTNNRAPEFFIWHAYATKRLHGPMVALELLDKRADIIGPEVLHLRAQCLLDYHRVDTAVSVVDQLQDTGALPEQLKKLRWSLAIRKGDLAGAMSAMPEIISSTHQQSALELYFQLKDIGDRKNIIELTRAFGADMRSCAEAIRNWQSRSTRRALKKLSPDNENPCISTLVGKLFRGRVKPVKLKSVIERAAPEDGPDLRLEVDRALATWLADGRDAAQKILSEIWELMPEGAPIRWAVGRAFIEMDMPKRALKVLSGLNDPEALALKYSAARMIKGKDTSKLVQTAIDEQGKSPHPATAFVTIQSQYSAGRFQDVSKAVDDLEPHSGHWTAEISNMVAKAINLVDDRTEADRLLAKTVNQIGPFAGMDESWDVKLAQIRLNMRRGGKFKRRAISWLNDLKRRGLKDPRLLFGLAKVRISKKDDEGGLHLIKRALKLDPTFKPAYLQLAKMDELDESTAAIMKRTWPGWSP
ncbi:MAG: hypothetical protein GY847_26655 [Proteobacteria bacterium]|nr:hypothetical protein [Pseudomonadota bacterium]